MLKAWYKIALQEKHHLSLFRNNDPFAARISVEKEVYSMRVIAQGNLIERRASQKGY